MYERVIIDRKKKTVDVDRIDGNWWHDEPFMGRRDRFYIEDRDGQSHADGQLAFVRHDYWISTLSRFQHQTWSHFSARSYKRAFASTTSSL